MCVDVLACARSGKIVSEGKVNGLCDRIPPELLQPLASKLGVAVSPHSLPPDVRIAARMLTTLCGILPLT
jgi:hypothetical protein